MLSRGLVFSLLLHAIVVFVFFALPPPLFLEPEEVAFEIAYLPTSSEPGEAEGGELEPPVPLTPEDLAAQESPEQLAERPPDPAQPDENLDSIVDQTAALDLDEPDVEVQDAFPEPPSPLAEVPVPEVLDTLDAPDLPELAESTPPDSEVLDVTPEALDVPDLPELAETVPPEVTRPEPATPEVAEITAPEPSPLDLPPEPERAAAPVPLPVEPQQLAEAPEPAPLPVEQLLEPDSAPETPPVEPQEIAEAPLPVPPVAPADQDILLPEEPPQLAEVAEPVPPEPDPEPRLVRRETPQSKPDREVTLPEVPREVAQQEAVSEPVQPPQVAAVPSQPRNPVSQQIGEIDLVRSIQQQVEPCWRSPPGQTAAVSSVVVLVTLNRNGTIRKTVLKDRQRAQSDQAYRALARGAEAAFLRCGPYQLPGDQYAQWRELEVDFHAN